jgi:hypothetical protein
MHEYLLALWGMIVGEMFDLEVSYKPAQMLFLLIALPEPLGDLQQKKKTYLLLHKCTNQP